MARKYLFADESGNFDFRCSQQYPGASRFFSVGTVLFESEAARDMLETDLLRLRRQMLDRGLPLNGEFHATSDKQVVRDGVFDVLARHEFVVDVTILEKAKAQPHVRSSDISFFKYAWFYHFKYFAPRAFRVDDQLTVVAGSLGTKAKARAFRASIEDVVGQCTDIRVGRQVVMQPAATELGVQAADYALWAVMREVEYGDGQAVACIRDKVRSQFQLFRRSRTYYYGPKSSRGKSAK